MIARIAKKHPPRRNPAQSCYGHVATIIRQSFGHVTTIIRQSSGHVTPFLKRKKDELWHAEFNQTSQSNENAN